MSRIAQQVLLVACSLLPTTASALARTDIMIGWQTTASSTSNPVPAPPTLIWSRLPQLDAVAIEELEALSVAVAANSIVHKALIVADNGRTVALQKGVSSWDPPVAPGVTVWPDWRIADKVIAFPDMAQLQFLSNFHVMISHAPKDGPYVTYVVDLRRPETRYQFSGYQLSTLRVTDGGKWAALMTDGALAVGQFDPAIASVIGTPVPIAAPIENLLWRKDGRILVVERPGPTLATYVSSTWAVAATHPGGLGPTDASTSPAGRDSFLAYQPHQDECTFTVTSTGQLSSTQWPHQVAGETGVSISPSRKFIKTQIAKAGGAMAYYCRRTPDATSADVVPEWPQVPAGTRIQSSGWLHWEP